MSRCDFSTHSQCSCKPSGVPCRAQPGAFEIIRDANNSFAVGGGWLLVAIFAFLTVIGMSAKVGFERQAKAYEIARRV